MYVDIDPKTYNIDPQKLQELLSTNPTHSTNPINPINSIGQPKVLIPVHLYGQPADMDPIMELAQEYDLRVIEDCAQSPGAICYTHQSTESEFAFHWEQRSSPRVIVRHEVPNQSRIGDGLCLRLPRFTHNYKSLGRSKSEGPAMTA